LHWGADPNQIILKTATRESSGRLISLFITPLLDAVIKDFYEIVVFLLQQSKAPITFANLAKTCAYFFALMDVNGISKFNIVPHHSINLKFSESTRTSPIGQLLSDIVLRQEDLQYEAATIATVLDDAMTQGNSHFKAGEYEYALHSFYMLLLFGNSKQRFSACYNIASCYRQTSHLEAATDFYEICIRYAPISPTGQDAAKLIKRMQPQKTAATQPPPNYSSAPRPGR